MATVDLSPQSIEALAAAVRGTSGEFASFRPSSDPSGSAERTERADRIRFQQSTKDLKTASKAFDKLSDTQNKTADQIKKQVELNSYFISNAVDGLSKLNIGPEAFNGLEDIFNDEERLKVLTELTATMSDWTNRTHFDNEQYDSFVGRLNDVGMSFDDLGVDIRDKTRADGKRRVIVADLTGAKEKLKDRTDELSQATRKRIKQVEKRIKTAEIAEQATKGLIAGVTAAGTIFVQESRKAMDRGVGEARSLQGLQDSLIGLRISTSYYMQILGDTRNIQHAINQSGGNFTETLKDTAGSLLGFAGSSQEAANAAAGFMKNTTMMGVKFSELEEPMKRQASIYKSHYRAMGYNLDQFNQLTEELLADTDVRNDIARLNKQERQAFVESLQKRTAEFQQMGYSIERAKELNKHFARMSGQNPLERLQQAAKERAMMGALGMAEEGAQVQRLMTLIPTLSGTEKDAAAKELTKLRQDAANELKRRRGKTTGEDVAFGMMQAKFGLKDTYDMFQNEAMEGREFDRKQAHDTQKAIGEVTTATKAVVAGVDQVQALAQSSSGTLAVIAGAWVLQAAMGKGITGINTRLSTLIASGALTQGGGLLGGAGKMAKGIGAGALLAYSAQNVGELVESGGKTSSIYEATQAAGDFIGEKLFEIFGDKPSDEERLQVQKDIAERARAANELQHKATQAADDMRAKQNENLNKMVDGLTKLNQNLKNTNMPGTAAKPKM